MLAANLVAVDSRAEDQNADFDNRSSSDIMASTCAPAASRRYGVLSSQLRREPLIVNE